MVEIFNRPAMVIGHPGHELRAFKFIKEYQPDIFIITDGSGASNGSRIKNTINIVESMGSKVISLFNPFTDREIYTLILEGNIAEILKFRNLLAERVNLEQYDLIMGDSLEGFNPTHDLCRYVINSIVKGNRNGGILNYSFDLDTAPDASNKHAAANEIFSLDLDSGELEMKFEAAVNYPELKFEVDKVLKIYGKEAFKVENYTKVNNPDLVVNWDSPSPKYEKFGEERVKDGLYTECIEFEKHMKPIALSLLDI